jgi:hypothetical protein
MAEICRVAMLYLDADEGKLTMGEAKRRREAGLPPRSAESEGNGHANDNGSVKRGSA